MKCLCCGKVIKDTAADKEKKNRWHSKCIKKFFGTTQMPALDLSEEKLEELASMTVNKGLTVPGVQKKLSLHLSDDIEARLTIVDYPTGYILKPQTAEYDSLPEYEHLAMNLAETAGIQTVPHALMRVSGQYVYITKRIDREIKKDSMKLFAMEDFCQISNRLTQDKYKGSYESCGRIIKKYSIHPGLDLSELFLRTAFSFVIGNSDMHLKNFSLIENDPAGRQFSLSKAYDILPVNMILPEDEEQLALTLNGKKKNIRKKDFFALAQSLELPEKSAKNMLKKLCTLKEKFLEQCDESYLSAEQKAGMKELIVQRIEIITI